MSLLVAAPLDESHTGPSEHVLDDAVQHCARQRLGLFDRGVSRRWRTPPNRKHQRRRLGCLRQRGYLEAGTA